MIVPDNYMAVFNATTYVTEISVDTPELTPIINITLYIDNVFFQNPQLVFLSLIRSNLVQSAFKFDVRDTGGDESFINFEQIDFGVTNPVDPDVTPIIVIERTIVYFDNTLLDDTPLPVTLDFDLSAVVVSRPGLDPDPGAVNVASLGIVTINPPPGKTIAATTTTANLGALALVPVASFPGPRLFR